MNYKKAWIVAVVACLLWIKPGTSSALVIDSSAGRFDITPLDTSFGTDSSLLQSQIWWQDKTLAEEFATLVNTELGRNSALSLVGPFFAFDLFTSGNIPGVRVTSWQFFSGPLIEFNPADVARRTYAIARPVPAPEPASIALIALGLLAIRRRITS